MKSKDDADLILEVVSTINAIHTANEKAQRFLNGDPENIPWPDSDSVFEATVSSIISATSSKSKSVSKMSSRSSHDSLQNRQKAAAEVAATQEVIKIMKTQHQYEEEIQKLEAEDKSNVRKIKLEQKKKQVERLEELKRHNAAQARLQVYAENIDDDEGKMRSAPLLQQKQEDYLSQPSIPISLSQPVMRTQVTAPLNQPSYSPQRVPLTQAHVSQSDALAAFNKASNDLVRALAEAITANRIPIPEPAVFSGEPLKYNDWKLSFQTLIDCKNLTAQEKLFFLLKYVSGTAKIAIKGHFLVGTEAAYIAAWNMLEDRLYRNKIQSWHKIATKDTNDLREFVDFLSSVESAMPYVQSLQALNDCVENQRISAKLPEWLSSRWNRAVTKFQDEYKGFPDFKYFVEFLNKEARIACNPITSLQAIKPVEQERFKQTDQD
ncbi:Dihydroorotase [Labeo rohita]|uniref:Dihydroorotase n=1 Tax=Labeo rohita TaxID=84645 RepID=A0ABQ8L008_LABRO|nr:Dihydroorotase [Labeo rohita]